MKTKYNNHKTVVDNILFHSKKEAQRYGQLKLELGAKRIQNLRLQVPFVLLDDFFVEVWTAKGTEKRKISGIKYIADFTYDRDGYHYVEDVKGYKTGIYQIKRKLFVHKYPELVFIET